MTANKCPSSWKTLDEATADAVAILLACRTEARHDEQSWKTLDRAARRLIDDADPSRYLVWCNPDEVYDRCRRLGWIKEEAP